MQSQGESVYRYKAKAKAERLFLPILFFFICSLVLAYTALLTARGFQSAFLWLLALGSFAYVAVPIWCLTRDQHIRITPHAIQIPKSPLTSRTREIPFTAISYLHQDEHTCFWVFSTASSRRSFCIKQSWLPSHQDFDEICSILSANVRPHPPTRTAPVSTGPLFELFVGDDKVAHLHDPKREEMFWCSYRVAPVSEDADRILHDEAIWNEVRFTVRARDGRIPNAHTFTGGDFVSYCRRETDRLSFRSLWPIDA